ncbi:MAG: ribose-5-phosphate isomerase RpiA [Deltaproteobacteria bacterium]|nr:ribose-5-phosphate isomerase RpiA [Deltaproteobacteria bacterium]MDE0342004.1 ribose-5-phosphate isomerase RpiA [Deltaproteobacteria bacterium]
MAPNPKKIAGERATDYVAHDMIVGLGTGSTAYFAIVRLAARIREESLRIRCIPTSERSATLARELGIPLTSFAEVLHVDVTIDGADEVDPAFNLIKGGGGALLREKFVASASDTELIIVDESKLKQRLGAFPLPVEVVPFGWQMTRERLRDLGCDARFRSSDSAPFVTDNGNYILDCSFGVIEDPPALEREIVGTCGVVDCGIFSGLATRIIIGKSDGSLEERAEPEMLA